jgi:Bacterial cadherin-like domain
LECTGAALNFITIPTPNFNGTAGFDYTARDSQGAVSTSRMTVMVGAVNDAPVATGETLASTEDIMLAIAASTLLANDTDVDTATDSQTLSIQSVAAINGAPTAQSA